jgi:hypothetical protein
METFMKASMVFIIEIKGWRFKASGRDLDKIRARDIDFYFVA